MQLLLPESNQIASDTAKVLDKRALDTSGYVKNRQRTTEMLRQEAEAQRSMHLTTSATLLQELNLNRENNVIR
eukprot:8266725-Karenia_brevis.AAC.1